MGRIYELLGIPRTFDEFVSKSKENRKPLEIVNDRYYSNVPGWPGTDTFNSEIYLKIGVSKLRVAAFSLIPLQDVAGVYSRLSLAKATLEESLIIAERVQGHGARVIIDGKNPEQIRKSIEELERLLKEMNRMPHSAQINYAELTDLALSREL